ncbi:MAG: YbbR-like domain-containing protein [Bacillota bacterium]
MGAADWRNMSLRILSVLLALLLWVYVTNEQNPAYNQILSINLQQRGMPEGMVLNGNIPQNVSIRVQGTRGQVAALTPADFEAVLSLAGLTEGEHSVPVKVNAPQGLQISKVTPERISLSLESIIEQQVEVSAALKGAPARGYTVLDPVILPSTVTVKGPRSKVSAINGLATVTVELDSADRQVEKILPVTVAQSGISVLPLSVKVTVPVTPMPVKTVPVRAGTTGSPAGEYEISGITVSPGDVQVMAPAEVLAGIRSIEIQSVDVTGATGDVTVKAAIIPPSGAVDIRPATVEVIVNIKKKQVSDVGTAEPPKEKEDQQ